MALYRQPGCERWYIRLRVAGRLVRKTTGTSDRKEAEAMEAAVKCAMRARDGRRTLCRLAEDIFPETGKDAPLGRLWQLYAATAQEVGYRTGETTTRKRESACLRLVAWAKGAGVRKVSEVDGEAAVAFLGAIGGTTKTKRNVAGELSAVWRTLARRGWAEGNPWLTARPLPQGGEEKHGRAFSDEELAAIWRACEGYPNGEEWRDMATVALYTGLRLTDVMRLEGVMVDWERGVLALTPRKTARHGIAVSIPLHPKVAEVLRRRGGGGPCFPAAQADTSHVPHFSAIIKRAGLTAGPGEALTFHCLRHTFATRLAEAGVPEDVRMQLCGHTVRETARKYNHDTTNARAAVLALK